MWLCVFVVLQQGNLSYGDLLDKYFDCDVEFSDFYDYLKINNCVFYIETYNESDISDDQYDELRRVKLNFVYRCDIKDVWHVM